MGHLQSRNRRYIMERFLLEVNEDIETHVTKEKKRKKKNKQFVSLIDKKLVLFEYSLTSISAMTCLFLQQGQQEPMRSTAKPYIFTPSY